MASDPLAWNRPGDGDGDGPAGAAEVRYGPEGPTEAEARLLGALAGKRVLGLGCGPASAAAAVAMAGQGAKVIAVDPSADAVAGARRAADRAGVRVEVHHGDPAELPFVRADSIDVAVAAWGLARVDDLSRVFRQVHRVLRTEGPLVLSLPHPAWFALAQGRSWFDRSPVDGIRPRTVADLFTALGRAGFRVDTLIEPEPPGGGARVPTTLVVRARKVGT
ncbi:MAG TPA: methyltransferase domain-containing protein [Acidimicrobiales bacterium]|jgi:SAM-dependent methyltransferase